MKINIADVEVVIRIPEEEYRMILLSDKTAMANFASKEAMMYAIKNGTVLEKGHGDLVDRKALLDKGYQMEPVEMWYGIKHADAIIAADKTMLPPNDLSDKEVAS